MSKNFKYMEQFNGIQYNNTTDVQTTNPTVVSPKEIEEYFEISKSDMIRDLYYRIIESCEYSHHGIFINRNNSAMCDFFNLIKNNVDTRAYYKDKFKI